MTADRKRGWGQFALVNGALLLLAFAAFPLLVRLMGTLPKSLFFCAVKRYLHLYCFTCGGTRATQALLRGDLLAALRGHAAVVWTYGALAFWDSRGLVRLLSGKKDPYRISKWFWWGLLFAFLLYGVLRDVSLVCGWDWAGDFS